MGTHATDILVIGAGMVGAAFAAALKDSPLSVTLIDAGPPPGSPPDGDHFDSRISAVSPGTRAILEALGAWELMAASRVGPYQSMFVWDAGSGGKIGFDAAEMGEPWLGYIVENLNIHQALLRVIESAGNIQCRFDRSPERLEIDADHCRLALDNDELVPVKLAVGADGAGSWVREALGIPVDSRLYGERAFVGEVTTELPHQGTAWQRFLPTGPIAFLPLANGHSSVVWTCDSVLADELAKLDGRAFGRRLEVAFDKRLGAVEVLTPVVSFDLSRRRARRYVVERGALIGDAAHVVHPLAGQGANLGFADAWSLSQVVLDAQRRGADIGRRHALRRYERWRRSENCAMLGTLDVLHGLFSTDSSPIRQIRGRGLSLVDSQRWIKQYLARRAFGANIGGGTILGGLF